MRRTFLFIAGVMLLAACQNGLTRYVNPLVGTDFHGHTYPGAIAPFGQIQPSPDTRLEGWDGCSAYHYSDDTIYGFSHTHLSGTGCEDYGDILVMPVMAEGDQWRYSQQMPQTEYLSEFSHRSEKATPGYYRVVLDRNRIMVELTADRRVACHRYSYPSNGLKGFIIDLCHRDKVITAGFDKNDGKTITGWRESNAWNPDQKCFFALRCSEPIKEIRYFDGGHKALVVLPSDCKQAEVQVAISGTDSQGARGNLATADGKNFDAIRSATRQLWEKTLGKIQVEGGTHEQRQNFYTALYHCYTSPYLWSDADGRYRAMDDTIRTSATPIYTVFSLWDTYRSLHPLMTLIEPETTEDWISTMLNQYETGGELTMWELASHETHCMIGYHACPVILEAYRTGLLDRWTPQRRMALLNAMVATSNRTEAHLSYAEHGYMDSQTDNESVSKTLEYAYDDWCIATYAQMLAEKDGPKLSDSAASCCKSISREYLRRANSWRNVMDADGFMHARRNGGFSTPFDPTEVNNNYTEANCWQYSTYVPHDIPGWIEMIGGKGKAEAFLDSLFTTSSATTGRDQADITGTIGQYAHGNEPSHHAAFLYAYLGAPDKTDSYVRQILDELYTPEPDGLCGNEDCGQMSAWYVMSAMGLYPVCPGSGEYVTCTPLFDKVTIHRSGTEGDLVIKKSDWQPGKFWRNGEFADSTAIFFKEEDITTPAPYFGDWQPRFEDSTAVSIYAKVLSGQEAPRIYYTLDGSTPDTHSYRYTSPFIIRNDALVRAIAYDSRHGYSATVDHRLKRFVADKRLRYLTKPDPQYSEGGPDGLIDQLKGTTNYRIGGWQGWTGDMEVVVDMLQSKSLVSVGIDCLEEMRSWIFFPSRIEVSISNDGIHFTKWASIDNTDFPAVRERQSECTQHTFTCNGPYTSARYIRIKAANYGKMPEWHASAGEQAWVFVDEIEISSYVPTFINAFGTTESTEEEN